MFRHHSALRGLAVLLLVVSSSGPVAPAVARAVGQEASPQAAVGSAFTYQGQLTGASGPVNATCAMQFRLYDALSGGSQVGSTLDQSIAVAAGLFTASLDFGASAFDGSARWLEIAVQCPGDSTLATLVPRQPLTPTPYALYAVAAGSAPWSGITGVPAGLNDGDDNTTYSAAPGGGLSLVGTAFSVLTSTIQARVNSTCAVGSSIRAIAADGTVTCQTDGGTTYTAGAGLALTGTAFSVLTNTIQTRVSGTCAVGSSIRAIAADGTATCETDDNTTYSAGAGLALTGTAFSVLTNTIQTRVSGACTVGSSIQSIAANGTVTCESDDNTTYTAGDGLALAGTTFSAKGSSYANVVVVATSGGDFTSIQAALNSITGTANSRYLVWVAPGTYTETVTMKPYVDIEGAGELLTTITYSGSVSVLTGTVIGADNAELRSLSVANTGGADYATAIYSLGVAPRLTQVTASAGGASTSNAGVYNRLSAAPIMTRVTASGSGGVRSYGVFNFQSSPTMAQVSASASGASYNYGVMNSTSSPAMMNVTAFANSLPGGNSTGVHNQESLPTMTFITATASGGNNSWGVVNWTSSPTMTYVTASASGASVDNIGVRNTAVSFPTMLWVTASGSGGTYSYGVRNEASSPRMTQVNATASGGTNSWGVSNESASPTMWFVTATASGASGDNIGVRNETSSPTMTQVTATGSGGVGSYGVRNAAGSAPTMTQVSATASGGTYNWGVYNIGSPSVTMTDVTATASGGTGSTGVLNSSSSISMTNVTAIASGGTNSWAISNEQSSPALTGVSASAAGATNENFGVRNFQASVVLTQITASGAGGSNNVGVANVGTGGPYTVTVSLSTLTGSTNSLANLPSYTTRVGGSQLVGAAANWGTLSCINAFNGEFAALNSACTTP